MNDDLDAELERYEALKEQHRNLRSQLSRLEDSMHDLLFKFIENEELEDTYFLGEDLFFLLVSLEYSSRSGRLWQHLREAFSSGQLSKKREEALIIGFLEVFVEPPVNYLHLNDLMMFLQERKAAMALMSAYVTVHGYFSSRGAVWFAKWAWRQAVR